MTVRRTFSQANFFAASSPPKPPPTITTRGSFSSTIAQCREIEPNRSNFYSNNPETNRSFRGGNIVAALVEADANTKLSALLGYSSSLDIPPFFTPQDSWVRDQLQSFRNVGRRAANPRTDAVSSSRSSKCSGFSASLLFARSRDL